MNPVEAFRAFISVRLTAAAAEILSEFQQAIGKYREEIDTQRRLLDINVEKPIKSITTDDPRQHFCIEEQLWNKHINPSLCQEEQEPPQVKDEPEEPGLGVKQEEDIIMVTVIDETTVQRDNLSPHDSVKEFINVQLTAAAEEIFREFQQSIVQFQEEIDTQHRLLEITLKPQIELQKIAIPELRVCKEEQEPLWNQEINSSLDQEEPEALPIKQEEEELCTSQDGEDFGLKQEINTFMMIPAGEQSEPESESELLHSPDSGEAESQHQKEGQHVGLGSTRKAELKPYRRRQSKNEEHSPLTPITSLSVQMGTHLGEKPHSCITCGKKFRQQHFLSIHMRMHTGEKPYSCLTCGKGFIQQSSLSVHMKTHTDEKPYVCFTCGKRFSQQSHMWFHMRTHTSDKSHSCVTCGKNFTKKSHLSDHVKSHTGERPFSCLTCGKHFRQRQSLSVHMRIHTGEKPYSCITCGKCFTQQSSWAVHTRTHTGEKPFSCVTCGKSYSTRSNLLAHTRSHFSSETTDSF